MSEGEMPSKEIASMHQQKSDLNQVTLRNQGNSKQSTAERFSSTLAFTCRAALRGAVSRKTRMAARSGARLGSPAPPFC
jgi:hypothetical protein